MWATARLHKVTPARLESLPRFGKAQTATDPDQCEAELFGSFIVIGYESEVKKTTVLDH